MKKMLKISLLCVVICIVFTGCKYNHRVAVIRNLPNDDHTAQFVNGAVKQGEAAGYRVDVFISDGDDEKTKAYLNDAIDNNYAGIILSHGKKEYSSELLKKAVDKGIEVVAFDTIISPAVSGISQTFQNDHQLATLSLGALIADKEKPVPLVKIWHSVGFLPLENRNKVYEQMVSDGLIYTVAEIDLANLSNVQEDVENKLAEILKENGEGTISGVWAPWDELAKGALSAIKKSERTDIQLVSIDISETDKQLMLENSDIWTNTAAIDASTLGRENMFILQQKIRGKPAETHKYFEGKLYKVSDGKVK